MGGATEYLSFAPMFAKSVGVTAPTVHPTISYHVRAFGTRRTVVIALRSVLRRLKRSLLCAFVMVVSNRKALHLDSPIKLCCSGCCRSRITSRVCWSRCLCLLVWLIVRRIVFFFDLFVFTFDSQQFVVLRECVCQASIAFEKAQGDN